MIWFYTFLIATALYYLGSRTLITQWFWSRMPKPIYDFLACPMCAPFWYTLGIASAALGLGYDYPGLQARAHALVVMPLSAIVVVPILVGLVEWGMAGAYHQEPESTEAPKEPPS